MTMLSELTAHEQRQSLPEGWRWARLGDVCRVVSGSTPDTGNPSYWDGDIVWITPTDLGKLISRDISGSARRITQIGYNNSGTDMVPPGSVVMSSRAPIGHLGVAAVPLCTNQGCKSFVPKADIDAEYLFFALKRSVDELRALGSGATFAEVSKSTVEAFHIPLPPLPEQQRLAALLTQKLAAVDTARAAAEEQLNAIKWLPTAYLRAAFIGAVELSENTNAVSERTDSLRVGTFADTPAVTSGRVGPGSRLPVGWKWVRLGEVCSITARQVDPKIAEFGAMPHVNGENILSGLCRMTRVKTAAADGMTSGKYLFSAGDVLYSKLRPYLRKAVVADFVGICSADMYPIQVAPEVLDPHYLAWTLVSDRFTAYADEESRRARMPKLNRDQLFSWQMPLPPLPEQKKIVAHLVRQMSGTEAVSVAAMGQLSAISRLSSALLQEAFAGKM